MTKNLNPILPKIPLKIQNDPELAGFFEALTRSLYQVWYNLNGNRFPTLTSTESIDVTSTGVTELFKVPENKTLIPLFIIIRVVDFVAGSKSTQVIASFGGNSPTFDDYLNSVTYTVASNNTFLFDKATDATELDVQSSNDSFSIIIETASDATTETWTVDVFGYLV